MQAGQGKVIEHEVWLSANVVRRSRSLEGSLAWACLAHNLGLS